MSTDQIPADDDPGFDLPAAEAYAMIVRAFVNLGMSRADAERYAFAAELEAGPIFRAAGRKQAAADALAKIAASIGASDPAEVEDHQLISFGHIRRHLAEGGEPNAG